MMLYEPLAKVLKTTRSNKECMLNKECVILLKNRQTETGNGRKWKRTFLFTHPFRLRALGVRRLDDAMSVNK
jgi:hypothetical protein